MSSALRSIDIIYETIGILCIGIIVLHGNLYHNAVFLTFTIYNLRIKSFLASVQISNKLLDSSLIVESFSFLDSSVVFENDLQPFCKKSHLTKTLLENIVIINSFFKISLSGKKVTCSCHIRANSLPQLQRIHGVSPFISLFVFLFLSLKMETSSHSERAFTTDARLREVLLIPYILRRQFTACMKDGKYTSTAGIPALWLIPTGIPLPLSITVIELSGLIVT